MLNILGKLTCVLITLSMIAQESEYVDEETLRSVFNECNVDYKLGVRTLQVTGIIKPYRPGIYKISKS
ncbi:hypothetical protein SBFV2_gp27 [Sulfolobales Beppu filamentous virus 2]|uniref:Uncharacterized protein n=1 Tax=Sulfolobales Beppu filamentous virus 2 TaxID=2493123 RepID=A0A3Q8Q3R7_9VIRU|nr:hypothetical protein HOU84_gp27 [Sulfolobales Beppu filamentous virus 2]AZI75794.1 hypothetical protein SBFV2_gp27 [Sulfolobales Beppu filamentous virus 2]